MEWMPGRPSGIRGSSVATSSIASMGQEGIGGCRWNFCCLGRGHAWRVGRCRSNPTRNGQWGTQRTGMPITISLPVYK